MTDDTEPPQRDQFVQSPKPHRLMSVIRFLAEETEVVFFTRHARERMDEREITNVEIYRGLRLGDLCQDEGISPTENPGEWKCKVLYQPRGSRWMGIITVVKAESRLIIKTVEWEETR